MPDPAPRPGFLDRAATVAGPGFNRWLVPPAALAIHLSIGQVYSFSVYKGPLKTLLGPDAPADWSEPGIAWVFSIAIVFLGLSAALFGWWLERAGPRKAMLAAATCFGLGFVVAAGGVYWHQLWLVYLGYGVLGGIGLGLGYISPVSTLIKWFPDRPGLATGLAIMGFGGGAMVGSPLAQTLMGYFSDAGFGHNGVVGAFLAMGAIYFTFMLFGMLTVRVPAPDWKPAGYEPPAATAATPKTGLTPGAAMRTPQFWFLWGVLFCNVTAGIALLEQAALMVQDLFYQPADEAAKKAAAAAGGGFVGLLSLFNMAGRFGWSSLSDVIGRKPTYMIFFALGATLYALLPQTRHMGSLTLFVLGCGVVLTMYGGGFATIPAYLKDRFGTSYVGAIHGRLLTAWSAAGIAGPALINYPREYQLNHGVPSPDTYDYPLYAMAALLAVGFVCNLLVTPLAGPPDGAGGPAEAADGPAVKLADRPDERSSPVAVGLRWLVVGLPLAWGVTMTVKKSLALFQ